MKLLLGASIFTLIYGLWASWVFFQGDFTRTEFLRRFELATLIYFVGATIWAYKRNRPT